VDIFAIFPLSWIVASIAFGLAVIPAGLWLAHRAQQALDELTEFAIER